MNEQIAKLANESGFDVDKTGIFGNYSEMHRIEKFAKLIVEDCLRFVEVGRDKTDIRHLITACFLMDEEQE